MRFAKGHGTGNDFVIIPDPDGHLTLTPPLVAALCDRRRGLGGDGLLAVVRSAKHPEAVAMAGQAEWFMDYRNGDGSLAEMCGNGVRVFARYLIESGLAEPAGNVLPVATRAGVVLVELDADALGVDMVPPRPLGTGSVRVGGELLLGTAVSVGNPHLVCRVDDLTGLDLTRPPALDPAAFPEGANVEFFLGQPALPGVDAHVRMRVYERGSAETLSCGSGACAVAAVALGETGRDTGRVAVELPGGRLTVDLAPGMCRLTGPAVIVATGEVDPDRLPAT
jgi:diaminopimelate epimerase